MENSCEVKPKPKNFKEFITSKWFLKTFSAVIVGGILGFLYFYFENCPKEACQFSAGMAGSVFSGAFLGFFITNRPCGC